MAESGGPFDAELSRIEESALWSAQGQFEQAKQWRVTSLVMTIPSSALAGASGVTALASTAGRIPAAIIALVAAALGAVAASVNAAQRAAKATNAGNAYLEVQTAARQARELDSTRLSAEELRKRVETLTTRRNNVNRTADVIGRSAYRRAARNIRSGGQEYVADAKLRRGEEETEVD